MKGAVFIFLSVIIGCLGYQAVADELHGKRIFLRAWTIEEALEAEQDQQDFFREPSDPWDTSDSDEPSDPWDREIPPMPPVQNKTLDAPPKPPVQNKTNSAIWRRGESLAELTPDLLPLTMHHEDGSKLSGMLLQRNFDIEHPMSIQFGDEETYESIVPEGTAMYHDTMSGAMIAMKNRRGVRHFDGSFHVEGLRYELHPDENDDGRRTRGFENHAAHIITRVENIDNLDSELKDKLIPTNVDEENRHMEERGSSTDYKVEMALVIDYSEYYKWTQRYKSQKCINKMLKYKFSYIYHAMDRTLKTVSSSRDGFTVRLYIKKLHVVTDQADSAVLDKYNLNGGAIDPKKPWETVLHGTNLLEDIASSWINTHKLAVTGGLYDTVMYYHGYTMEGAVGWAYTGGVCGYWCTSTVSDHGFETWTTAVHELGHSLGANHDGPPSGCSDGNLDVMTNGWGKWSGVFSSCSKRAMKKTLARKSCLSGGSSDNDVFPSAPTPGKTFDADWQCRWKWNDEYQKKQFYRPVQKMRHCHERASKEDCVYGIQCGGDRADGKGLYCKRTGSMYQPADGTSCGTGKVCMNNECVSQ